jgi:hypothetical protein
MGAEIEQEDTEVWIQGEHTERWSQDFTAVSDITFYYPYV